MSILCNIPTILRGRLERRPVDHFKKSRGVIENSTLGMT